MYWPHDRMLGWDGDLRLGDSRGDRLYRLAVRRVIGHLVEENRRLRMRPYYRQGSVSSLLTDALAVYLERRGWL